MKPLHLAITLVSWSLALSTTAALDAPAPANIAAQVDRLLNARGKVNAPPLISNIVSLGDAAVSVLTQRLESATNRMSIHWAVTCLCRVGSDAALQPVRALLRDTNRYHLLTTVNQAASENEATRWGLSLTTAIREYPIQLEAEIVSDLIRLSDPAFGGMVHYYATERLREMIRRQPAVAGAIIAALDDRPEREEFSWNLGEILAAESGHANRWGVFGGPTDWPTLAARRNRIWREWWIRNKDRTLAEWRAEAEVISATIPQTISATNAVAKP